MSLCRGTVGTRDGRLGQPNRLIPHKKGNHIMEKKKLSYQRETPLVSRLQNAWGVALAALARYRETEDKSVFSDRLLRPEYLRLPQAERERLEKESKTSERN